MKAASVLEHFKNFPELVEPFSLYVHSPIKRNGPFLFVQNRMIHLSTGIRSSTHRLPKFFHLSFPSIANNKEPYQLLSKTCFSLPLCISVSLHLFYKVQGPQFEIV